MKYILLRDRVVLREGLYWLKQNPQLLLPKKSQENQE